MNKIEIKKCQAYFKGDKCGQDATTRITSVDDKTWKIFLCEEHAAEPAYHYGKYIFTRYTEL